MDLNIIKNGGWHFTRIISPEKFIKKNQIQNIMMSIVPQKNSRKNKRLNKRRVIDHDHLADSRENKFGKEFPLKQLDINKMPKYIRENQIKYNNWLDLN